MARTLIFLDDERYPEDVTWVDYPHYEHAWVCTFKEAFTAELENQLQTHEWRDLILSFDHDLQDFSDDGTENTGYDAIKEVVESLMDLGVDKHNLPTVLFHSKNPVGVKNMSSYWMNYIKSIEEVK